MLDFTSALYLGLHHPNRCLKPYTQFTTGVPATLKEPPGAEQVADELARLQGCEHGVLGPSTFHLFWDLFGMLARRPIVIYMDDSLYPIARWGVERAAARGIPVRVVAHHDANALRRLLKQGARSRREPVLVTDGFCPACGKAAPLPAYLDALRVYGGRLVLDDTQALGILGSSPSPDAPYGRGGGGMLRRFQISGQDVLAISSLAKAFGAPTAVLCGSRAAVEEFKKKSETRVHCSPPCLPAIRAAEHALFFNRRRGNRVRLRLAAVVSRFPRGLAKHGLRTVGGLFPVQTLQPSSSIRARRVHEQLLNNGIRTVLRRALHGEGERISLVITARHTPVEIDAAIAALAEVAKQS